MRTPVSTSPISTTAVAASEPSEPDHIDVVGASGRAYRFNRLRAGFPLSPVGGTYLLARHQHGRLDLVYIATAESLLREAGQDWPLAAERFAANQLFSRLNVSGRSRDGEFADILAAHPLATEWAAAQPQRAAA